MKAKSKAKKVRSTAGVELGGGNIFADLQLPDSDELLAKAQLAHAIAAIISAKK